MVESHVANVDVEGSSPFTRSRPVRLSVRTLACHAREGSSILPRAANNKNIMDKITQMMVITMEECGELTQVCSKLLRKRHTRNEISDETKYKLTKEVADVMCMIELMKEEGLIEHHEIVKGIQEKRDKLKIWSNLIGH